MLRIGRICAYIGRICTFVKRYTPMPTDVSFKQEDCNCFAVRHVTQFYDQRPASIGLSTTQFSILTKLERRGPLPINALAKAMVTDRRLASINLTDIIWKAGMYVDLASGPSRRDPDDRGCAYLRGRGTVRLSFVPHAWQIDHGMQLAVSPRVSPQLRARAF
jgi:hypothetical protein